MTSTDLWCFDCFPYSDCCYLTLRLPGPEAKVQKESWHGVNSYTLVNICGHLTVTWAVLSMCTLLKSDTIQPRYFTALWKRPPHRKCWYISITVSGERGKCVYMIKSIGTLIRWPFCVYLHICEWFISKPPEMLQKATSSLYPLTESEQTVSANCGLFRDVSVLLRQHWRCLSVHTPLLKVAARLLYEETYTHTFLHRTDGI